jgi:hypothetical protein
MSTMLKPYDLSSTAGHAVARGWRCPSSIRDLECDFASCSTKSRRRAHILEIISVQDQRQPRCATEFFCPSDHCNPAVQVVGSFRFLVKGMSAPTKNCNHRKSVHEGHVACWLLCSCSQLPKWLDDGCFIVPYVTRKQSRCMNNE